jgi:release factor glutamine methyltransferase
MNLPGEDMKIDPNKTPKGISLDEIREMTRRDSDRVRFSSVKSRHHTIHIVALPTVYLSDDFGDSRYFAEKIPEFVTGRFLEIGAGTGIVTIAAILENSEYFSRSSEKYVAIDINPQSVKNTRINAMINGLEDRIDVRQGDVFEPLEESERFDCIFWDHPFHKGNADEDIAQRACFDPLFQGLEKYVKDGHRFLNKDGKLLLGSGNFADLDDMRKIMDKHGCEMNLIHYIHRPFKARSGELNTYNIYEIRKTGMISPSFAV